MAGWTATVCEYMYCVPDEQCARTLVEALADFGFALVSAAPYRPRWSPPGDEPDGEWNVRAVDRAARLVARDHHGYWHGGTHCDVSQFATLLNRTPSADGIERRTPGARPQTPRSRQRCPNCRPRPSL